MIITYKLILFLARLSPDESIHFWTLTDFDMTLSTHSMVHFSASLLASHQVRFDRSATLVVSTKWTRQVMQIFLHAQTTIT
jgi:hypothetical protein